MKTQHTATPWIIATKPGVYNTVKHTGPDLDGRAARIIGSDGRRVCDITHYGHRKEVFVVAEANAAFICKAVNCHEELVKALKALLDYDDDQPAPGTWGYEIYEQARQAIQKAGQPED